MTRGQRRGMHPSSTALVAMAAALWGLAGGLGGLLMDAGWDPLTVTMHRALFGLVCVLVWLWVERRRIPTPIVMPLPVPKAPAIPVPGAALILWSLVAGLGVTGNFTFYFLAIGEAGVAVAATLMYSAPVFVFVASVLVRIERPTWPKALAIVLVSGGVVLLTDVLRGGAGEVSVAGAGFGLLAGASYALFIFGFQSAAARGPAALVLSIAVSVVVVALLPLVALDQVAAALTSDLWPTFVLLGVLGAGLSFALYIIGLRNTPPTIASVLAMVEPVTAAAFGVVVLGETLSIPQGAGMAIILVTATALSRAR